MSLEEVNWFQIASSEGRKESQTGDRANATTALPSPSPMAAPQNLAAFSPLRLCAATRSNRYDSSSDRLNTAHATLLAAIIVSRCLPQRSETVSVSLAPATGGDHGRRHLAILLRAASPATQFPRNCVRTEYAILPIPFCACALPTRNFISYAMLLRTIH